jgi:hypothetical protein
MRITEQTVSDLATADDERKKGDNPDHTEAFVATRKLGRQQKTKCH